MSAASITRDPNLSLLSLQIANEIDKVYSDQNVDPNVIASFKEKLSRKAGIENLAGKAHLSADAFTIGILGRAIQASQSNPITEIDQLVDVLKKLLSNLSPEEFQKKGSDLARLKQFCLSLHEAIIVSRTTRGSDKTLTLPTELRVS